LSPSKSSEIWVKSDGHSPSDPSRNRIHDSK
jgi:hypothetical protein